MQWLFGLILRNKNHFSFIVAVILSVWMMRLAPAEKVSVARLFSGTVFYPAQFVVIQFKKAQNIWHENKKLREKVVQLRLQNARMKEAGKENERLRRLLNFKEKTAYTLVPAEVVAQNPGRRSFSVILNMGKSDGIQANMPVVGMDGVAGKIISTTPFSSHVQLLNDPNHRLSVMIRRSRVAGILEATEGGQQRISVEEHADVVPGDEIITSGLGGVFPKGLRVGKVKSVSVDKFKIFKTLNVELFILFDYIEEVFILKRKHQWQGDTTDVRVTETNAITADTSITKRGAP